MDGRPVGWTEGAFSVSEDGAAQYSLSLWMPEGGGDVRPELALSYNSPSGNGLLSVGWSLQGLSTIAPCDRTFAQDGFRDGVHFDGSNALCLDGDRLLSLTTSPVPEMHYKTERESFSRIVGHGAQVGVPHAAAIRRESVALTFRDQRSGRDARPYGPTSALAHGAAKSSDIERVRRDVDRAEMCVARADQASAARRSARLRRREAERKPDVQP